MTNLQRAKMYTFILAMGGAMMFFAAHNRTHNRPRGFYPALERPKQDTPGARFPVGIPVYPVGQ
jgi:tryptophan-rich sensory protein